MSKRILFAALIGALLFSAASQSQSAPKVYAEASLSVPPDRVVNLKFLTEGRILFETCHFREDCDLQILGVTEGKVDRSDARRVPYSEAANLFRELNQVKRFGCSGPADNVADAMIFAMTCEKRT